MSGKACGLPLPKASAWCKKPFKHTARLPASLQGPSCISARVESLEFVVWWMSVHWKGTWGFQIVCRDSTGAQVLASELPSHIPTEEKFRLAGCWQDRLLQRNLWFSMESRCLITSSVDTDLALGDHFGGLLEAYSMESVFWSADPQKCFEKPSSMLECSLNSSSSGETLSSGLWR